MPKEPKSYYGKYLTMTASSKNSFADFFNFFFTLGYTRDEQDLRLLLPPITGPDSILDSFNG